jgi:hypothetical protein
MTKIGLKTTQYSLLSQVMRRSPIRPCGLAKAMVLDASTRGLRNLYNSKSPDWSVRRQSAFEFACGTGAHHQSFALGLNIELQRVFYEPRCLRSFGFLARVPKWAPLRRYLNLHPVKLSNPFAGQIRFGTRGHPNH